MTDTNEIKAGEYELLSELFDQPLSKPEDKVFRFKRYRRGAIVTLNEEEAKRLVLAGAVVEKGALQRAAVAAAKAAYEAALAALGPVPDGVDLAEAAPTGETPEEDGGDDSAVPEHLRSLKTIADLRAYAGTNDIDLGSYTLKADIVAAIVQAEAA